VRFPQLFDEGLILSSTSDARYSLEEIGGVAARIG
jgi:hypothetical protein